MNQVEVLIVGGGQAGLATSYFLRQANIPHCVLEARERVGDQWRARWDSLHLFSPARYNELPGCTFPAAARELASKDQMANYLEAYVQEFQLPVLTSEPVRAIQRRLNYFLVHTPTQSWQAQKVVIASGAYRDPFIPDPLAQQLPNTVSQIHSSTYQNPAQLAEFGRILVVGAGASGLQISRELAAAGHQITLAGPKVDHLPRTFFGQDIYWWLYRLGVMQARIDSPIGRYLRRKPLSGEVVVGDDDCAIVAAHGMDRRPKLTGATTKSLRFADNSQMALPDLVIWCTGYRNRFSFLNIPEAFDDTGQVQHERGRSPVEGLYFMGMHHMIHINSSLIGGVGADAQQLVGQLLADYSFESSSG